MKSLIRRNFPALTHRSFLIFWLGQFVSLIGSWMQSTIQPYLAYRLSDHNPLYLGLVGFAGTIPSLLLMLPAGVLIERMDKRKVVIFFQIILMLSAFTMAFLTLSGRITIWHIILLALVNGICISFELPARQSMLSELVDRESLSNAIALNSTIFNGARVLGPSLTTPFILLIKNNGEGWAFLANAVSFLFVIIGLLFVRTHSNAKVNPPGRGGFQAFLEGQQYIRSNIIITQLILMIAIPAFFGFPFMQMMPVVSRDILHAAGDTETIVATRNSLLVTFQGVGALVGSLLLAVLSHIRHKGRWLMIGQIVFGIGLLMISFAKAPAFAYLMMIPVGWGLVSQLSMTNTLIQLAVPDHLRGRVMSTYLWVLQSPAPFGSLFLGWLVSSVGASGAIAIGGFVCLLGYAFFHITRPAVRTMVIQ